MGSLVVWWAEPSLDHAHGFSFLHFGGGYALRMNENRFFWGVWKVMPCKVTSVANCHHLTLHDAKWTLLDAI